MKAFITGATGFIGSRLAQILLDRGIEVHAVCRTEPPAALSHRKGFKIFRGSIEDAACIDLAVRDCDYVFHLAAYARNWAKDYTTYYINNVLALKNILDAAKKHGVRNVVCTSTILTYGPSNGSPVTEKTKRAVDYYTQYERSKAEADAIIDAYVREGMHIVVVHPTRVFGPGVLNEANSATKMIAWYLLGKWRTIPGNGSAIGNYSFVDDVALGHIHALQNGQSGEHYILGGANLSYSDFFAHVDAVSGDHRALVPAPYACSYAVGKLEEWRAKMFRGYPFISTAWVKVFFDNWACSSKKAVEEIGYAITPFSVAMERTIRWLRKTNYQGGFDELR